MDHAEVFEVPQSREELDGESSDEPIVKALVVVHLYELVQIDTVEVEHDAKVVAPNEIVLQLDDSLNIIRVVFLEQKKQLCFNCCLVIILFLVFYHFDCHMLARLVVFAFQHLAESPFSDQFVKLEAVADLIA